MKRQSHPGFCARPLLALVIILVLALGGRPASAEVWKFGVMGDTQWTCPTDPAGKNPNNVAASIVNQINAQFIKAGVKFVIQVGDLTEDGSDVEIATRETLARDLYKAGIGFFPMRGNHETYTNGNLYGIPAFQVCFPQTRGLSNTFGATNFSSPVAVSSELNGMSYSFDFGNGESRARFVIIDPWVTPSRLVAPGNGYNYGYSIADQQEWISNRLDKASRGASHAFVFAHQNLIGENHQDTLFSGYADANPAMQNAFRQCLRTNDVRYYICGHDHVHQRSLITSPNGACSVEELICASNSSKFYTPKSLTDSKWFGQKRAETSLAQELYTVGFYIFTIDGPRVTVDYYSDNHGNWQSDGNYPNGAGLPDTGITPTFNFVKKDSWGYSLNGQQFEVGPCQTYAKVVDTFERTTAKILSGTNAGTRMDYNGRPLSKVVSTGWIDVDTGHTRWNPWSCRREDFDLASDVLTLTGMTDLGTAKTDTYALSLTFDKVKLLPAFLKGGSFGLASLDDKGNWVNTVELNNGASVKKFVVGPWKADYGLGTFGINPEDNTAWAVINHSGTFAVVQGL